MIFAGGYLVGWLGILVGLLGLPLWIWSPFYLIGVAMVLFAVWPAYVAHFRYWYWYLLTEMEEVDDER